MEQKEDAERQLDKKKENEIKLNLLIEVPLKYREFWERRFLNGQRRKAKR